MDKNSEKFFNGIVEMSGEDSEELNELFVMYLGFLKSRISAKEVPIIPKDKKIVAAFESLISLDNTRIDLNLLRIIKYLARRNINRRILFGNESFSNFYARCLYLRPEKHRIKAISALCNLCYDNESNSLSMFDEREDGYSVFKRFYEFLYRYSERFTQPITERASKVILISYILLINILESSSLSAGLFLEIGPETKGSLTIPRPFEFFVEVLPRIKQRNSNVGEYHNLFQGYPYIILRLLTRTTASIKRLFDIGFLPLPRKWFYDVELHKEAESPGEFMHNYSKIFYSVLANANDVQRMKIIDNTDIENIFLILQNRESVDEAVYETMVKTLTYLSLSTTAWNSDLLGSEQFLLLLKEKVSGSLDTRILIFLNNVVRVEHLFKILSQNMIYNDVVNALSWDTCNMTCSIIFNMHKTYGAGVADEYLTKFIDWAKENIAGISCQKDNTFFFQLLYTVIQEERRDAFLELVKGIIEASKIFEESKGTWFPGRFFLFHILTDDLLPMDISKESGKKVAQFIAETFSLATGGKNELILGRTIQYLTQIPDDVLIDLSKEDIFIPMNKQIFKFRKIGKKDQANLVTRYYFYLRKKLPKMYIFKIIEIYEGN